MWPSGWSTSSPQPGQQQQQQQCFPNNLYAAAYGAGAQQAHGGSPLFGQQAAFMQQQGAYGYGAPAVPGMAPPLSQENIFNNIIMSLEQRKQQALLDLARACGSDTGLYPSYNVGTQPQPAAGQNWTKEQQNPSYPYFPQNQISAHGTQDIQDVHRNANNGSVSSRVVSEQSKQGYTNNGSASSADHQNRTHYQTYQQGPLSERHETSEKVADKGTLSSKMVQEPIESTNKDASQDMNDNTIMSGIDNIVVFQISQLSQITNGYSNILGKGSFGEVYLGILNDGQKVAVKVPMRATETDKNDFKNELRVQSRIKHKNVVKLLGYCLEGGAPKLVYEFAANGNLYDKLHGNCRMPMLLDDRLRILLECAEALAYIHSSTDTCILHGDVKSANILLDGNYTAKVSDFGLSRLLSMGGNTMHTKNVIGSIGYIDPLFMDTGILTQLSDVYSFGVVMVEIITRRKASDELGKNNNLASCFQSCLAKGKRAVHGIVDKEIATRNNRPVLEEIAKLALDCLSADMKKRPEMKKVAHRLSLLTEPRIAK